MNTKELKYRLCEANDNHDDSNCGDYNNDYDHNDNSGNDNGDESDRKKF